MDHGGPALAFAIALGAGVFCQVVARHLRIPSIVLLLLAGVALGPDALGWVRPESLGVGLGHIVQLAVAIILFEGGLNLEIRRLRRESLPIRMLVTAGVGITAVGAALAARHFMEWPWSLAAIFGALVTVTGPTVVKPLLRLVPLRPRLATVLEAEGVLIDPIGAILAALTLEIVLEFSLDSVTAGLGRLALRLGVGVVAGIGFGWLLARILRTERLVPEGLENLVTLGGVLVLFVTCDLLVGESGILAVTLAGVVVGNMGTRVGAELGEFEEVVTIGMIGVLFVLLAADVRVAEVVGLGRAGLLTVGALILVVRPLDVAISTLGSELDARDRAFLAWVAPRGVVAAAIASLFAAVLAGAGEPRALELRALVFLTIAVTVVLQGTTAPLVARILGVRAPGRETMVVLGAEELALALGDALREAGRSVLFVDSNPRHCHEAETRGFPVVFGNALAHTTLARARLERARAVVGLIANDEVNSLFAREARDEFGVRESYVALGRSGGRVTEQLLAKQESRILFDGPKDVERWNVRFRHGIARVVRLGFVGAAEGEEPPTGPGSGSDSHILLVHGRGDEWNPYHARLEPRTDDVALAALYTSEEEAGLASLRRLGWEPLPGDAGSQVE